MKFLEKTRENIGRYFMTKKARGGVRQRELKGLNECRSVLIVSSFAEDTQAVHTLAFTDYLKNQGAEVFHLIYNPDRKKKERQTHVKDIEMITRDHLNFFLTPGGPKIQTLLDREFDLMIDLTKGSSYPLEYCSTVSKAKLKAGASGNHRSRVCDITIDISGKPDIGFLIGQMKHYLTIFNSKEHVA